MSVVFVNCTSETFTPTRSGAIATFLWKLCCAAQADGIRPVVVTPPGDATPYAWEETVFITHPRAPTRPWSIALCRLQRRWNGWRYLRQKAFAQRVVREIRRRRLHRFPLILHNDPEMAVLFRQQFPESRIIHHFHNQHTSKAKMRRLFGEAGLIVTAVSDFTARWAEEFYGLEKRSVRTIYNGVDSAEFSPSAEGAAGPVTLSFVGRTGIEKAPDLLLKAALEVASIRRDFAVQIVGGNHWGYTSNDPYQTELQTLSRSLESHGIPVRFTGFVSREEMPAAFRRAHIHVVPSRWDEPFGLTTVEGMASGLAVIASRTGGSPEVVGDAGILFERENVRELATHLKRLIADGELRKQLAVKARRRAESFRWEKTWREFREIAGV